MSRLIQKCFIFAVFLLPIAGHGIAAIAGSDDARFFLHWSMLIASLIGSGFGCFDNKRYWFFTNRTRYLRRAAVFCHYQFIYPMADTSCSICTLYRCHIYFRWGNSFCVPRMASAESQSAGKVK